MPIGSNLRHHNAPFCPTPVKFRRKLTALGNFVREEIEEVEEWDGYTTTRKTLHFTGKSLGIISFSNDASAFMLTFAEFTPGQWNGITPFKVGQPLATARKLLGKAASVGLKFERTYAGDVDAIQFD